jgi:hypothetical protein
VSFDCVPESPANLLDEELTTVDWDVPMVDAHRGSFSSAPDDPMDRGEAENSDHLEHLGPC